METAVDRQRVDLITVEFPFRMRQHPSPAVTDRLIGKRAGVDDRFVVLHVNGAFAGKPGALSA